MNANVRPPDPRMQNFGTSSPGQGGGWRGFASLIAFGYRWRYYGLAGLVVLGAAELLPDGYRPTDLFGRSIASIETSDIKAKQDVSIAYQKGLADAQAKAQAEAAQQIELTRQQLAQRSAAQQGQVLGAVVADLGCMGGGLMSGAADPGTRQTGQSVARTTCGVGDAIRNKMAADQAQVLDQTGTTHAWNAEGGNSGGPAMTATADAAPLNQGEYNRMARLEAYLPPAAVQTAKTGIDLGTNKGARMYLARLGVAAGEGGDDNGPTQRRPIVIDGPPPTQQWQLPAAVRSH